MTFEDRTTNCPECGGSGYRLGFRGNDIECFDCSGSGTADVRCADCDGLKPLNNDGLCESCLLLVEVELRDLGNGRWGVAA